MKAVRFFDPLYGKIEVSEREAELVFAPEVQRLRYVRMCNINSLLISGASEISRFEHVIGVLYLAKEWTRANGVNGQEAEVIHAAALLHDVQTGPFGHSLEYILADNEVAGDFRHEDMLHGAQNSFLQLLAANVSFSGARFSSVDRLGSVWGRVATTIRGDGPYGILIAGRVDLDNVDNVVRLAYHVGVADRTDAQVCISLARDLRVHDGRPSISSAGIDALLRWQEIRKRLYTLLLHDWAEFSAKAMLTVMMELAVSQGILGADSWRLTDDELLATLTKETVGEAQSIGEIGRRLMLGDLYTPLGLWRSPSKEAYASLARADFKRTVESKLGEILRTKVIFHVILDSGKTERKVSMYVRDLELVRDFGQDTSEVLIGVFLSRSEHSAPARAKALSELYSALENAGVERLDYLDDPVDRAPLLSAERQLQLL